MFAATKSAPALSSTPVQASRSRLRPTCKSPSATNRPCPSRSRRPPATACGGSRLPLGDDGIVGGWTRTARSTMPRLLINHEELYSLFLTDYDFYERLMQFAANRVWTTRGRSTRRGGRALHRGQRAGRLSGPEYLRPLYPAVREEATSSSCSKTARRRCTITAARS